MFPRFSLFTTLLFMVATVLVIATPPPPPPGEELEKWKETKGPSFPAPGNDESNSKKSGMPRFDSV